MPNEDEMLHQVGAFEALDAKRVLEAFEAEGVPCEVDRDDSSMLNIDRTAMLNFGMYPEGSKLLVFVPESSLSKAEAVVRRLFPV